MDKKDARNNFKNKKPFTKGDPNINRKGRPVVPKTIKEFIKSMEMIDDDIMIPVDSCELITKNDQEFYKIKGSNGLKMAMNAYQKALKGDIRFLDWITKMGYGGGYESSKTELSGKNGGALCTELIIKKIGSKD